MGGLLSSPSQSHIISASYLRFPPWPTTTAPYVQCINADFLAIVFAYFVFSSLTSISIGVLITHLVRNKNKKRTAGHKNVATNMAQQQWIGWLTKIAPLPFPSIANISHLMMLREYSNTRTQLCRLYMNTVCSFVLGFVIIIKINWTIVASFRLNSEAATMLLLLFGYTQLSWICKMQMARMKLTPRKS